MFEVKVSTAVSSELLSVSDLKTHLAVTHTDDDTYLTALIKQVREDVENYCGISIGEQTRQWIMDGVAFTEYAIPYGPIADRADVTNVQEKTANGTYSSMLLDSDFDIDGLQFLTFTPYITGRFKLTYDCGYSTLPHGLKRGMLEECAFRYEHRGDEMNTYNNSVTGFSQGALEYLMKFKDFRFE